MATTATPTTTRLDGSSAVARVREVFPFRHVVLPWLVARVLVVTALVFVGPWRGARAGNLIAMDGQWFRMIALDWYDRPYVPGAWSEYPFFPLFPSIAGALMRAGSPSVPALAGTAWLFALVALAGVRRLAVTHLRADAAACATWLVALAPGALTMVLGYADSIYLAALVWALVAAEDRRWWVAGTLAAVATASRPNGVIAAVALVVVVLTARAGWRALTAVAAPSLAVLGCWMAYLRWATGDALVFWSSKDAWDELSLATALAHLADEDLAAFHLACFVVVLVPYLMRVRAQPPAWAVIVVLTVGPPLVLGVEGLARYALLAFPMQFALADVLSSRRWLPIAYVTASSVVLVVLSHFVVTRSWLP